MRFFGPAETARPRRKRRSGRSTAKRKRQPGHTRILRSLLRHEPERACTAQARPTSATRWSDGRREAPPRPRQQRRRSRSARRRRETVGWLRRTGESHPSNGSKGAVAAASVTAVTPALHGSGTDRRAGAPRGAPTRVSRQSDPTPPVAPPARRPARTRDRLPLGPAASRAKPSPARSSETRVQIAPQLQLRERQHRAGNAQASIDRGRSSAVAKPSRTQKNGATAHVIAASTGPGTPQAQRWSGNGRGNGGHKRPPSK
jgi:hypothetical protein